MDPTSPQPEASSSSPASHTIPPPPSSSEPPQAPPTPPSALQNNGDGTQDVESEAAIKNGGNDGVQAGVKRNSPDSAAAEEQRDAKRAKEEEDGNVQSAATPAPSAAPVAPPPSDQQYTVGSYVPPAYPTLGSTRPMTSHQNKLALNAVHQLKKAKEAFAFLVPVDTVALGIPHYPQYVTKPMDLGTIEAKLLHSPSVDEKSKKHIPKLIVSWNPSMGTYNNVAEVVDDIRQIWKNTKIFNGPDHFISLYADKLDEMLVKQVERSGLDKDPPPPVSTPSALPASAHAVVRKQSISNGNAESSSSARPKREIHAPPPLDSSWTEPKRSGHKLQEYAAKKVEDLIVKPALRDYINIFMFPVDPVALNIPEYLSIIKKPMDLSTIRKKIDNHAYTSGDQINTDVLLMVDNAMTFNRPGEFVHIAAEMVKKAWQEMWAKRPVSNSGKGDDANSKKKAKSAAANTMAMDVDDDLSMFDEEIASLEGKIADLQSQLAQVQEKRDQHVRGSKRSKPAKTGAKTTKATKPKKIANGAANGGPKKGGRPPKQVVQSEDEYGNESDDEVEDLTMAQKQELADKIATVSEEVVSEAINIIQTTTNIREGDEIEIDIDSLPPKTVAQLYQLIVRGGKKASNQKKRPNAGGKDSKRQGGGAGKGSSVQGGNEADRIRILQEQLAKQKEAEQRGGDYDDGACQFAAFASAIYASHWRRQDDAVEGTTTDPYLFFFFLFYSGLFSQTARALKPSRRKKNSTTRATNDPLDGWQTKDSLFVGKMATAPQLEYSSSRLHRLRIILFVPLSPKPLLSFFAIQFLHDFYSSTTITSIIMVT